MTNKERIERLRKCASFKICNPETCDLWQEDDCRSILLKDAAAALEAAEKRIAELMPKEGKWIDGDARQVTAICSVCGHLRLGNGAKWANMYVPYCEICGARMRGEHDGES